MNAKDEQKYAFSVTIENARTGESEQLQLPATKENTKDLFDRLKIKGRYYIKGCDYPINQIKKAINQRSNLNEINYCAAELLKCDEEKLDFVWKILDSGADRVESAAEVINLLNASEYTYSFLSGITTYEQVCEFHLAVEKMKNGFSPVQYIPREKYCEIGKGLSHAERGRFVSNGYLFRNRCYYPDVYLGDNFPEEYKIVPL